MARLIDADALKHMIESMNFAQPFMDVTRVLYGVGIEIDNAPTIDAVSVVRCRECKWYNCGACFRDDGANNSRNADDFCSYGERKESE